MKVALNIRLTVSPSPHIHDKTSVRDIMRDVIIALAPAGIVGIAYFGIRAAILMLASVGTCVLSEYIIRRILKRSNTLWDLSAVVTGLLLAYNVPVSMPVWMLMIGDVIAIVIVKQFFGGIGQNFVNPAIAARIILMTSFPVQMTSFTSPLMYGTDAVTTATPLALYGAQEAPDLLTLFIGTHGGCIGEVCGAALIAGFIYLLIRKVITPSITAGFIGTVAVIMFIAGGFSLHYMMYQILSGGLLLGAIFMATDYTTSPVNERGRWIFGIGCGIITCIIRLFGSLAEGVSFAIILMNILVPHIEKLTADRPFGVSRARKG